MFLPSLITELCKRAYVSEEYGDIWTACDKAFDPLRVKGGPGRSGKNKKRKLGGEGEGVGMTSGPTRDRSTMEQIEHDLRVVKEHLMGPEVPPRESTESSGAGTSGLQDAFSQLADAHVQLRSDLVLH